MRDLNISELKKMISEYSLEIEYVERDHLHTRLNLFMSFLYSQPISQRLLNRIEEDYIEIKNGIPQRTDNRYGYHKEKFLDLIQTPDNQEAFSFFIIDLAYKNDPKNDDKYLYLAPEWCDSRGDLDQWNTDFIKFIFKPFIRILNWYLEESQSRNPNDYFSNKEINDFSDKLDNLLNDIRLGQEVLYNDLQNLNDEFQDLKVQLKNMKKKNWGEVLKGKLIDLVWSSVISQQTFAFILKTIIGEESKFLNN